MSAGGPVARPLDIGRPGEGWLRRLARLLARHRGDIVVSFVAAALGSASLAVVPLVARYIVDDVVVRGHGALVPALLGLLAAALFGFAMSYLRRYRGGRAALAVQLDLRNAMQATLMRLDATTLATMPTGQLVSRASSDSTLVQGLLQFLPIVTGNVLMMLLSLVVMAFLSPVLALVALLTAPALVLVSYRMRARVFPATWDAQQREGDIAQIVDEDVAGVRVVKAFGQERRELERVVVAAESLYGARMRTVRLQARYQPTLEAIPGLAQVAVLALGGWLALHGHISVGTFLAFSTYVAQFAAPARQLAGLMTMAQQARAGVERIFQLLDIEPQIADRPGALAVDPAAVRGDVRLEGVTFAYAGGGPVLDGLDLHVRAGERVALVGASGSGKSTAVALVGRFHDPTAGRVLLDGTDVRDLRLDSLRRSVGYAFEESFLFSDTVRANIAYARPDATDEQVVAAARVAGADDFVRRLPRGYETQVGERGLTLSGGQRQRLALARAVLADPAVLVLDDATSAVDATTEEGIHAALGDVLAGRTTILVAHRVSTLHLADRVVLLDRGRVAAEGTHEDLLASNETYRELLSGLDAEAARALGDRVEALADVAEGRTTAAAWRSDERQRSGRTGAALVSRAPSLGPGLGGGGGRGGGGGWRLDLAATPELLARVDALPPIRDTARVDVAREDREQPGFSLRGLVREFRRPLGLGLLLVVLDALADLLGPLLVRTGVDDGVVAGSVGVLAAASAGYLVLTLADLVDQVGETFVMGRAAEQVMLTLRVRVWAQLQRLSLDYYEREMAGRIMTRMTTDVDQFESLVENGLLAALVAGVTFVGVGVALVLVQPVLGLCTLTVCVPLAAATVVFRRRSAALYDDARERLAVVNADFQESVSGIREAQAFAHEGATIARFERLGGAYLATRLCAQRLVATYFPFVQLLSAVADVVVLGVGARLVRDGDLSAGGLIAFLLYVDMFFSPVQQLSQVFDAWQQTRISSRRIDELFRLRTLTPEPSCPVPLGPAHGAVALDGVRFAYPAAPARAVVPARGPADARGDGPSVPAAPPPEALREIDLAIAPGETVALVGETGAGKSTVLKLVARFYDPDAGRVAVDGHDLRSVGLRDFRSRLGYVPQESFLFTGTVRDNIAYGRPDASDAEVEAAARAVGAHAMIAGLPGGYLAEVSERGRSLSAGERQLLALARAHLVDPALLLLDEATSNLDLATEARVTAAMRRVAHGRTTVLIAHRLQTARSADRIVVLEQGRVVESGTHDELVRAGGRYAAMWHAFESARAA